MNSTESSFNRPSVRPELRSPLRPGRPRRRTFLRVFLLGSFFIAAILVGVGVWVYTSVHRPVEHQAAETIVTVEPGMGMQAITGRLAEAGIIRNPLPLRLYLRLTGRGGQLKAGDYEFASPISPLQAVEKIRRGEVAFQRVTIPEGFNRFDIAKTLAEKTSLATEEEFFRLMGDTSAISRMAPQARNLEGYLFPDTYNYTSKTTAPDLIRAMAQRFQEVFTPEWRIRASQMGMSVQEVVTLASIIEEEARVPDERPLISSVFHNRLKRGMALGSDPTFIYAAILAGEYDGNPNQRRYIDRDSPYNTYRTAGLPPGPIASPGRASLEAALYPVDSEYLYFVVTGTEGRHKFSRSAAEHDAAVIEYRNQQREMREK